MSKESSSRVDHIHYGAISASDVIEAATRASDVSQPATSTESSLQREKVEMSASAKEHQATLDAFRLQQAARVAAAPSSDHDVKMRLREFDEPICLFGEGVSVSF